MDTLSPLIQNQPKLSSNNQVKETKKKNTSMFRASTALTESTLPKSSTGLRAKTKIIT